MLDLLKLRNADFQFKLFHFIIFNSLNDIIICRNYHVFYYLLAGADGQEREALHLCKPEEYYYLRQVTLVYIVKQ